MSPHQPQISVVVCTHNRSASLRRMLESCHDLIVPGEVTWELLVIANACTDNTTEVVASFVRQLPVKCIEVPAPGKSAALNRAIELAQGSLLLFTDDDVTVAPNWLSAYWYASRSNPQDSFFGGPVVPEWEDGIPPAWITDNMRLDLLIVLKVDHGVTPFQIAKGGRPIFVGANMAARKSAFDSASRYDERIGPKGKTVSAANKVDGEEIILQRQWIDSGKTGRYVPDAFVHHYHPVDRLTEKRLRLSHAGKGIREVRLGLVTRKRMLLGAPFYFWRLLMMNAMKYAMSRPIGPSKVWVQAEMEIAYASGVIAEMRRMGKSVRREG